MIATWTAVRYRVPKLFLSLKQHQALQHLHLLEDQTPPGQSDMVEVLTDIEREATKELLRGLRPEDFQHLGMMRGEGMKGVGMEDILVNLSEVMTGPTLQQTMIEAMIGAMVLLHMGECETFVYQQKLAVDDSSPYLMRLSAQWLVGMNVRDMEVAMAGSLQTMAGITWLWNRFVPKFCLASVLCRCFLDLITTNTSQLLSAAKVQIITCISTSTMLHTVSMYSTTCCNEL